MIQILCTFVNLNTTLHCFDHLSCLPKNLKCEMDKIFLYFWTSHFSEQIEDSSSMWILHCFLVGQPVMRPLEPSGEARVHFTFDKICLILVNSLTVALNFAECIFTCQTSHKGRADEGLLTKYQAAEQGMNHNFPMEVTALSINLMWTMDHHMGAYNGSCNEHRL